MREPIMLPAWVVYVSALSALLLVASLVMLSRQVVVRTHDVENALTSRMDDVTNACKTSLDDRDVELLAKVSRQLDSMPNCRTSLEKISGIEKDSKSTADKLQGLDIARLGLLSDAVLGPAQTEVASTAAASPTSEGPPSLVGTTLAAAERISRIDAIVHAVLACPESMREHPMCQSAKYSQPLARMASDLTLIKDDITAELIKHRELEATAAQQTIVKIDNAVKAFSDPAVSVGDWLGRGRWNRQATANFVGQRVLRVSMPIGEGLAQHCERFWVRVDIDLTAASQGDRVESMKRVCAQPTNQKDSQVSCVVKQSDAKDAAFVPEWIVFDARLSKREDSAECSADIALAADAVAGLLRRFPKRAEIRIAM